MKILLTAFKGAHNSSFQIVQSITQSITQSIPPSITQKSEYDKLVLTNSYKGIKKDITAFDFTPYNAVIMFGLDSRLRQQIRIEPCAMLDGNIEKTAFDVHCFADVFKANRLDVVIAKQTTSYLCNYAYYHVLEIMKGCGLFIHIPSKQHLTDEMKTTIPKSLISLKFANIAKIR